MLNKYVQTAYKAVAEYASEYCVGTQTPIRILAYKAFDIMMEALQKGRNPYDALNSFLGLSIPIDIYEDLYSSIIFGQGWYKKR